MDRHRLFINQWFMFWYRTISQSRSPADMERAYLFHFTCINASNPEYCVGSSSLPTIGERMAICLSRRQCATQSALRRTPVTGDVLLWPSMPLLKLEE